MTGVLPSVHVLSNCTHHSLAQALRNTGLFAAVDSTEVFSLPHEQRMETAERALAADFVLTIEHGESFGPLSTRSLRDRRPDAVVSMPTPFFNGLAPEMAYVVLQDRIVRSEGWMGDYQSALLLAETRDIGDKAAVVSRYATGAAFERLDVRGIWQDALAELRLREEQTELKLSPFIEARTETGDIVHDFMTFNHPGEHVINHLVAAFVALCLGPKGPYPLLQAAEHSLYRGARWPIHPEVGAALGLTVQGSTVFKQPDRLGGRLIPRLAFAEYSFDLFTKNGHVDLFAVATPRSLPDRMRPVTSDGAQ